MAVTVRITPPSVDEVALGATTFACMVADIAQRSPGAPAIEGDGACDYAALDELGRRAGAGLARLGIGAGDRVGLWLPNGAAWLALLLGCARLGAIAISINTRFRSAEVADIAERSRIKALAFWPGFKAIDFTGMLNEIAPAALRGLDVAIVYGTEAGAAPLPDSIAGATAVAYDEVVAAPPDARDAARPESPFIVFTTSGTTSKPKFVLHTHASVVDHARMVARACGFEADGVKSLLSIPLCGVFGFSLATATLAAGRPMVLMPAFDPAEAVRLTAAHAITHLYGSDDLFHMMFAAAESADALSSLRLCGYAAFNAALANLVDVGDALGVACVGVYGSSEVQALVTCQDPRAPADDRRLAGGIVTAQAAAFRIRDPISGAVLPPGGEGEIEWTGPSRFACYLDDDEATKAALTDDGYFRTGDLGRLTEDGRMVFLARIGDALRLGGFLVNPKEIEAHIEVHGGVAECKVVGVETEGGTRAVAFCIPEGAATIDEAVLRAHCAAGIAKYKVPVRFLPIDAFPMAQSPNGLKVQRPKLQAMAQAAIAAPPAATPAHQARSEP